MRITSSLADSELNWIERVVATFLAFWEFTAIIVGVFLGFVSAAFIVLVILQILFWIFL